MPEKAYKILYIGNFEKNSVGEPEIAHCLESLGHKVTRVVERAGVLDYLEKEVKRGYDFVLMAKCRVGQPIEVKRFMKGCKIPMVTWIFDLYFGL